MFSSSEQLHFQAPAAAPSLRTLGVTKGCHVNRQQRMPCAAHPSTHKTGSIQLKKRIWVNAATQALMHLDLCTMPLLFIPLPPWPSSWLRQWSRPQSELYPNRMAAGARKSPPPWPFGIFPHPDGILIFGSTCNYNFRAQDCIQEPKFPPWMPSSAQC